MRLRVNLSCCWLFPLYSHPGLCLWGSKEEDSYLETGLPVGLYSNGWCDVSRSLKLLLFWQAFTYVGLWVYNLLLDSTNKKITENNALGWCTLCFLYGYWVLKWTCFFPLLGEGFASQVLECIQTSYDNNALDVIVIDSYLLCQFSTVCNISAKYLNKHHLFFASNSTKLT